MSGVEGNLLSVSDDPGVDVAKVTFPGGLIRYQGAKPWRNHSEGGGGGGGGGV